MSSTAQPPGGTADRLHPPSRDMRHAEHELRPVDATRGSRRRTPAEPDRECAHLHAGSAERSWCGCSPRRRGWKDCTRRSRPNRARRATELVAYLALHADGEVTSDRLRTRVLGSSDADAASKTLFNIAAAARRAMGSDAEGRLLFPSGTRSRDLPGQRRRHRRRAPGGVRSPQREARPRIRMRPWLCCAPRSAWSRANRWRTSSPGYGWWEAEGHGARIAAVLVNAAERPRRSGGGGGSTSTWPSGGWGRPGWSIPTASPSRGWPCRLRRRPETLIDCAGNGGSAGAASTSSTREARPRRVRSGSTASWRNGSWSGSPNHERLSASRLRGVGRRRAQASFAAIDEAPRSTSPSAPAAL